MKYYTSLHFGRKTEDAKNISGYIRHADHYIRKELQIMKIALYKHNQTAYQAALQMLNDTGKAAIVHPTGTGKSFIGFKLCEDFPNKVVC